MKRLIRKKVDPNPVIPRGETEFEEKKIQCAFTLLYNDVSKMQFATFRQATEFIFRHGFFTGKVAGKRESSSVAVANNAEPQKGQKT
jgi:hypothetical protein